MKRSVLIGISVFLIFSASFTFFLYDNIFRQITGRQIFLDNQFEQPAHSFKPSNPSNTISLSPSDSCEIKSISSSHTAARIGDTVSIYLEGVDGTNCQGKEITIKVYEKDEFFNDYVTVILAKFSKSSSTVDFKIDENFDYLFNEFFEGNKIEIFFEVQSKDEKISYSLLSVYKPEINSLLAPTVNGGYIALGKGCTNAWYIDEDCDGYGVAAQLVECRGDCGPTRQGVIGDKHDADDNDSLINTPQTINVDSRYGDPATNFAGFKLLLNKRFGFVVNNVYFISLSASGAGAVNNVNNPYPLSSLGSVIATAQGGDVILFRAGNYFTVDGNGNRQGVINVDNKMVSSGNPLVIASYPGETVINEGIYGGGVHNSANIVFDGFIITCGDVCDNTFGFWGGYKGFDIGGNSHTNGIVFQNMEITRFQWGVHGQFDWGNITFRKIVVHDAATEHDIYSPSNCYSTTVFTQSDLLIEDSLIYRGRRTGYQNNGRGDNLILRRNIIHSNGGAGITFTSGVQNTEISNNIIFNNNHYGIVIWHDNVGPAPCKRSNENILIANNLVFQGNQWNGVCNSGGDRSDIGWVTCQQQDNPAAFSAISFGDSRPEPNEPFTGMRFLNNILVTQQASTFFTDDLGDIGLGLIQNNLFLRLDGQPHILSTGRWAIDGPTDGTHDSSCCSPLKYLWSLNAMQNHIIWNKKIKNNFIASSLSNYFNNAGNFVFSPGSYDFSYPLSTPLIDAGTGIPGSYGIPTTDILGKPRLFPVDIGPYEFIPVGNLPPVLYSIYPYNFSQDTSITLNLTGMNFISGAVVQICAGGSNCVDLPIGAFNYVNSTLMQVDMNTVPGLYEFRIRNSDGGISAIRSVTVLNSINPPNAPSGLAVSILSMSRLNLMWQDNSDNEVYFEVQKRLLPSGTFDTIHFGSNLAPNTNNMVDSGLPAESNYEYRVRANNGNGYSAWSNLASATTYSDIPIGPGSLQAVPLSANSVNLSWSDGSNDEQGFYLQYKPSSSSTWLIVPGASNLAPNTLSFIQTSLNPSTSYDYLIYSYTDGGFSAASNVASATTTSGGALPNDPSGLTVTTPNVPQGLTQLNLNWVDGSTNENNFTIERRLLPSGSFTAIAIVNANIFTFSDTGLISGATYQYRVKANNNWGSSGYTDSVSGTTLQTIPNAPTNLVATSTSSNSVVLNWQDSSNNEFNFIIRRRAHLPGGPNQWINFSVPENTNNYADFPLINSRNYEYQILANNSAGFSTWSISAFATTFACNPGQLMDCSNQNGVCAGSQQTCNSSGNWPGCNSVNYESNNAAYNANEIGLCSDGLDNDCDASGEFDYDGSGAVKGDNDCPVQVTGISAPSNVGAGSPFTLTCTSSPGNVSSVQGLVNSNLCNFVDWQGNNAVFNCVSSVLGNQQVNCNINTAYSYQNGGNLNQQITVDEICSTYISNSSCINDVACEWCLGCSDMQSSGSGDRCVVAGSCNEGIYQCIINQCNAVCDGTVNGCSSSQSCSLSSCGCTEESPVINNINNLQELTFSWGSQNTLTINGQYFATDAQLLIDGVAVAQNRLTVVGNSIIFIRNSEEFAVGTHNITILNPTSGIYSNSLNMTLTANPSIISIIPNTILNNILTIVNITGVNFDPSAVVIPSFLSTYINSGLIQLTALPGLQGADYNISVLSGDGLSLSNKLSLRVNYPFDHFLILNASVIYLNTGDSFENFIQIETNSYMIQENVLVDVISPSGINVIFLGPNYCVANISVTSYPTCEMKFNITTENLLPGQYNVSFISNSSNTFSSHRTDLIINLNTPPNNGGGPGGSGGSGGGGGSSTRNTVILTQCNDKVDNDGDGLVDYVADLGCYSVNDNSERDSNELVESNYSLTENNPQTLSGEEKDVEIRTVFWTVMIILLSAITVVFIMLIRLLRLKRRVGFVSQNGISY